MDKGFEKLEIDAEFKALIPPLKKEEYLQLELNIKLDGCREPIIVWDNIIIDGHNRYEICNRLHLPYGVQHMFFESRAEVIIWICNNQLGRRNITEETRRYLIGKQYDLEKVERKNPNACGFNQHNKRKREDGESFRRTAQKIGAQYHISSGAVQKYAIYSRALDNIGKIDPSLSSRVLSGACKISHENTVALSRKSPDEIRRFSIKQDGIAHPFTSYSSTRKEFIPQESIVSKSPQEHLPQIKIMPEHDPDSEIVGLTLTVPSWVSSIERTLKQSDISQVSIDAKSKLENALLLLQDKILETLKVIKEG